MREQTEIKDFTLGIIKKYSENHATNDESSIIAQLNRVISRGLQLDQYEADFLVHILSNQLKDDMIQALKKDGVSLILEADVQSNYADAWGQYCRTDRIFRKRMF